jgi:hypothetical protein
VSHPYRSISPWGAAANETVAVGWTARSHQAQIGDCAASVQPERPAKLAPYFTWKVTRDDHITMTGSAKTLEAAFDASERAAAFLNEDGWPSAFTRTGKVEARRG